MQQRSSSQQTPDDDVLQYLRHTYDQLRDRRQTLFAELGKSFYQQSYRDPALRNGFEGQIDEIARVEERARKVRNQYQDRKAMLMAHHQTEQAMQAVTQSREQICPNCGKLLSNDAAFCSWCGIKLAPHTNVQATKEVSGQSTLPTSAAAQAVKFANQAYSQARETSGGLAHSTGVNTATSGAASNSTQKGFFSRIFSAPRIPPTDKPLMFYKFLVYVSLYVSAIGYVCLSFQCFSLAGTFSQFSNTISSYASGTQYTNTYSSLSILMPLMGLAYICLSIWTLEVRGKLARFEKDAPKAYLRNYMAAFLLPITIGVLFLAVIGSSPYVGSYAVSQLVTAIIVGCCTLAVMCNVFRLYFDRRAELFVN